MHKAGLGKMFKFLLQFRPYILAGIMSTNSPNSHLSQLTILVETTTLPSASDPNDNIEAKNS